MGTFCHIFVEIYSAIILCALFWAPTISKKFNLQELSVSPRCQVDHGSNFSRTAELRDLADSVVSLMKKSSEQAEQTPHCNGLLLSQTLVLTTANCVDKIESTYKFNVFSSTFGQPTNSSTSTNDTVRSSSTISWTCKHPKYNRKKGYYDLAIIVLDYPMGRNSSAKSPSVCLWDPQLLPSSDLKAKEGITTKRNSYHLIDFQRAPKFNAIPLSRTLECPFSKDQSQFCLIPDCSREFDTIVAGSPVFVQLHLQKREKRKSKTVLMATRSRLFLIGMIQRELKFRSCANETISATDLSLNFRSGQLKKLLDHCMQSKR